MKENILIGRVHSIWRPDESSTSNFLLLLKKCNRGRILPFYGMHEVVTTTDDVWIKADHIQCILNVQHNCNQALCSVTHNYPKRIERKIVPDSQSRITHNNLNSYIINSAALYSAEWHCKASGIPHSGCTKAQWDEAIEKGQMYGPQYPLNLVPKDARKQPHQTKQQTTKRSVNSESNSNCVCRININLLIVSFHFLSQAFTFQM
ncbi:hypothetical protein DFH28DRAFT_901869 [Melampsora americana]|nr:hypothetical protein DFH28DRAFT_901869 [Melampsora americana]